MGRNGHATAAGLDVARVRRDFPAPRARGGGLRLVYLEPPAEVKALAGAVAACVEPGGKTG